MCIVLTSGMAWMSFHTFSHAFIKKKLYHHTCLAPVGTKKSISGLRPKKVVHHINFVYYWLSIRKSRAPADTAATWDHYTGQLNSTNQNTINKCQSIKRGT